MAANKFVDTEAVNKATAAAAENMVVAVAVGKKKKKTKIVKLKKEMVDWIMANPEHEDCACYFDSDFGSPGSFFHNNPVFREVDAGFQKVHDRELSIIKQFNEKGYDVEIEVELNHDEEV